MKKGLMVLASLVFSVFLTSAVWADEVVIADRSVPIPGHLDAGTTRVIKEKAPLIAKVCPGFARYAGELTDVRISKYGEEVNIEFTVPSSSSRIPSKFYVRGHKCFYAISADGKILSIAKKGARRFVLVSLFPTPPTRGTFLWSNFLPCMRELAWPNISLSKQM